MLALIILTTNIFWRIFFLIIIIFNIINLIISRPPPEPIPVRFEGPKETYRPLLESLPHRARGGTSITTHEI